ncbi:hypothetical protein KUTeg_006987 [Tegillarca granosa]|uniref:BHLH domain-containing protein n=1 Tax=Tegillarca granosa TaxID=220873 RepID=A0ABQ9FEA7_TEGGR|nr:hypothetical protein KUTeg_006987 [Tegillarca granosa]
MMSPCRYSSETFIKKNAGENSSIQVEVPVLSNLQNADKSSTAMTVRTRNYKRSGGGKSSYRHVPHCQKPPHLVARRNARERRRVQAVNNAFLKLRRHVPFENKHKRLSKVKTLRGAIEYITKLQEMILEFDSKQYEKMEKRNNEICVQNCPSVVRGYPMQGLRNRINPQQMMPPGYHWTSNCQNEVEY